jgi:hypothetical protein
LTCPLTAASQAAAAVAPQQAYPVLVDASDVPAPEVTNGSEARGRRCAPGTLVAPVTYRALLSAILERSHTFRRQCARLLAEPALTVRLYVASSHSQSRGRAATLLRRSASGLLAEVHIVGGLQAERLAELIGHELEHVIEQLDGVDLAGTARRAPTTVWLSGRDSFETVRAIQTGQLVAGEFARTSNEVAR